MRRSRQVLQTVGHLALLAAVASRPLPALALPAEESVATPAHADSDGGQPVVLEEVIVTANRRQQSIVDVPYNISATTAKQLDDAGVIDFSGLTRVVPGLVYNGGGIRQGGSANGFILRGLNASRTSTTDQPSLTVSPVSLYINDTPIFANVHLADVARIEVLRGPQGTLYGNGSVGGTIRVLYNEPDPSATSARVQLDSGLTDHAGGLNYTGDGMINIPLASTMALRVTAGHVFEHGFINARNLFVTDAGGKPALATPADPVTSLPVTHSQSDIDDSRLTYARAAFKFATGPFKLTVSYLHQEESAEGQSADTRGTGIVPSAFSSAVTPGFLNDGFDAAVPPVYGKDETGIFLREPYGRHLDLGTVEVSQDFGFATLTSSSSYYNNRSHEVSDISGSYQTNIGAFYLGFPRLSVASLRSTEERTFVQELRLVSATGRHLDWVVGAFYEHQRQRFGDVDLLGGWSDFVTALAGFDPGTDRSFDYKRDLTFRDEALFGELTWHITPRWQLTGGLRALHQKLDIDTVTKLPICGAFCSNDGADPEGLTLGADNDSQSHVLTKVNTSYSFSGSTVGYFNYSEGTRRGGANAVPTSGQFAQDPAFVRFASDRVRSYELGVKSDASSLARVGVDVFWTRWNQPILDIVTPVGGFFAAVNGREARTRGVELQVESQVTHTLGLSAGYSYTHAEVTSAFNVGGFDFGSDGETLPGVPKHQATVGADYAIPISTATTFFAHADGAYRSSVSTALTGSLGSTTAEGFWIWSLNAGIARDAYRVSLYVDNVGNSRGVTTRLPAEAVDQRFAVNWLSRPRTAGARLTYNF